MEATQWNIWFDKTISYNIHGTLNKICEYYKLQVFIILISCYNIKKL